MNETAFERDLRQLINRHSLENESHTPDFILAKYVLGCLAVFASATYNRDDWWGFTPWGPRNPLPGPPGPLPPQERPT